MNDELRIPSHVAVIMDGNGRWAKQHGLERVEGHRAGVETVERTLNFIRKYGIEYLTLYAFSTENWKRSKEEVDALMSLLTCFLMEKCDELVEKKVRLLATGRIDGLPEDARKALSHVMELTGKSYENTLILALNYGGRAEIADAAKMFAEKCVSGECSPEELTEETFAKYLYHPEIPDPDLMIRTSGEMRLSNFLLWELSYSEIYVSPTYWPDFSEEEFVEILKNYSKRDRRFGGRK